MVPVDILFAKQIKYKGARPKGQSPSGTSKQPYNFFSNESPKKDLSIGQRIFLLRFSITIFPILWGWSPVDILFAKQIKYKGGQT